MTSSRRLADRASGLNPAQELTGNRTMTDNDSGGSFIYNGASGSSITLTFPATLSIGFSCKIENAGLGTVSLIAPGAVQFGNASRSGLTFQWDVVEVELKTVAGTRVFDLVYNLDLPVLYAENNAAATRNATAMTALPGLSLALEAGGAYNIDILIPFTTAIATNTLRVGTSAWPTGATGSLEVSIYNSNSSGTAPKTIHYWSTSALAVTGTGGTAAVVGQTMLARVTGRIKLGSTAGSLAVTVGSIAATGNVSIASGAASMSASKVFDLGRT